MRERLEEVVKIMRSASFGNTGCWYDLVVEISKDRRWTKRPLNGVFLLKILNVTKSYTGSF